jgi:catechol-2,3-dioxygenase
MAIATLSAVTLDTADAPSLGAFYRDVTGWTVQYEGEEGVMLGPEDGAAGLIIAQLDEHQPAGWPDDAKQMHLDFRVDNLDEAERALLALGATKPDFQPGGERWRVLQDPAGHPFCISPQQ